MRALFALILFVLAPAFGHADTDNKTATFTAVSQTVVLAVSQRDKMVVQVTGAFTVTMVVEASANSLAANATYTTLSFTAEKSSTYVGTITAAGNYKVDVSGYAWARVRVSVYGSGSPVVTCQLGQGGNWPILVSSGGGGDASAANQVTQINTLALLTTTAASQLVSAQQLTTAAALLATAANQLSQITSLQQLTTTAALLSTAANQASQITSLQKLTTTGAAINSDTTSALTYWSNFTTQFARPNGQPVRDDNAYGYLTTTAYGTAGRGGSYTAIALTSAYSMNITVAAGVNAPCLVTVYPGNGPNASFYWNSMPGWLAPNTAVSVSSTPIMFTAGIGDFLNLSVTGAALSVTAQVRYAPIY